MMWEYIGTLFFGMIAFVLGYVLGKMNKKKAYWEGYKTGRYDYDK